jgi:hypothetical protein
MSPVQNAGRLREVSRLLSLDPPGPVSDHHYWSLRLQIKALRRSLGELSQLL